MWSAQRVHTPVKNWRLAGACADFFMKAALKPRSASAAHIDMLRRSPLAGYPYRPGNLEWLLSFFDAFFRQQALFNLQSFSVRLEE